MKHGKLITNIFLCFLLSTSIITFALCWRWCYSLWVDYIDFLSSGFDGASWYLNYAIQMTIVEILNVLAAISSIIILILFNKKTAIISNLKAITNAEWQEYKQARAEHKLTKKQARIAKLEKKLNKLKKDGE